ncbi:hypothetical protein COCON_G00148970, partial [Conger conger]
MKELLPQQQREETHHTSGLLRVKESPRSRRSLARALSWKGRWMQRLLPWETSAFPERPGDLAASRGAVMEPKARQAIGGAGEAASHQALGCNRVQKTWHTPGYTN